MRVKLSLLTCIVFIPVLALPGLAFFNSGRSVLSPVLDDISRSLTDAARSRLDSLLANIPKEIGRYLNGNDGGIGIGIEARSGVSGIPDLELLEDELKELFATASGDFTDFDALLNGITRGVTEAKSGETLSVSGQSAVRGRLEAARKLVETLDERAGEARAEFVTQNVLKKIALQNVNQGELLAGIQGELTSLNQRQDLANRNLSAISGTLDATYLAERAREEAAANNLLSLSMLLGLR